MKLPYTDSKLEFLCETKKKVRTKNRSSVITEKMIGTIVSLYNGKRYVPVAIVKNMLGHKLGEFVFTKLLGKSIHSSVKNKKKKKK
jgi:small subunit ribosomal protein S19